MFELTLCLAKLAILLNVRRAHYFRVGFKAYTMLRVHGKLFKNRAFEWKTSTEIGKLWENYKTLCLALFSCRVWTNKHFSFHVVVKLWVKLTERHSCVIALWRSVESSQVWWKNIECRYLMRRMSVFASFILKSGAQIEQNKILIYWKVGRR